MNRYMQMFLQVPDKELVDVIFKNQKDLQKYFSESKSFKDISNRLKYLCGLDIINDIDEILNNSIDFVNCINKIIDLLDEKLKYREYDNGFKEKFDSIIDRLYSLFKNDDYSKENGKLSYVVNNLIVISLNTILSENQSMKKLFDDSPEISEDGEKLCLGSVNGHMRTGYNSMFLSKLFMSDKDFEDYMNKITNNSDIKYQKYGACKGISGVALATALTSRKNVYNDNQWNNSKVNPYSLNNLLTFHKNYYNYLSSVNYDKIDKAYAQFIEDATLYFSERIYAFKTYEKLHKFVQEFRLDDNEADQLAQSVYKVVTIPDLVQRLIYIDVILEVSDEIKQDEMFYMNNILSRIEWDSRIYYPILMTYSLVCLGKLILKNNENANEYLFKLIYDSKEHIGDKNNATEGYLGGFANTTYHALEFYKKIFDEIFNMEKFEESFKTVLTEGYDKHRFLKAYLEAIENKKM